VKILEEEAAVLRRALEGVLWVCNIKTPIQTSIEEVLQRARAEIEAERKTEYQKSLRDYSPTLERVLDVQLHGCDKAELERVAKILETTPEESDKELVVEPLSLREVEVVTITKENQKKTLQNIDAAIADLKAQADVTPEEGLVVCQIVKNCAEPCPEHGTPHKQDETCCWIQCHSGDLLPGPCVPALSEREELAEALTERAEGGGL
jgi:hypothetical protein